MTANFNEVQVCLWDAQSGERIFTIPLPGINDPYSDVILKPVSPNGRYLLVNVDPDTGYLIDLGPWLAAGEPAGVIQDLPMKRIDRCSWSCSCVAFSPDSKTFTTGWEKDFNLTLWDTETVKPLRTFHWAHRLAQDRLI